MGASRSVEGGDAALATAVDLGEPVRFVPDATSDLARALGLVAGHGLSVPTEVDVLDLGDGVAVNMAVSGVAPDRLRWYHRARPCVVTIDARAPWRGDATGVIVANGEYLRGNDVVPRGHPADGRFEVHVYALAPGQRAAMRRRLAAGTHLPHPDIHTFQGRSVRVEWGRPVPLEVDGVGRGSAAALDASIRPAGLALVP